MKDERYAKELISERCSDEHKRDAQLPVSKEAESQSK